MKRLEAHETSSKSELKDEQLWTYLVACGYAAAGPQGVAKLADILTNRQCKTEEDSKIWMEVLPLPPRQNEGNTHLDLAIGSITKREQTESGIKLSSDENTWVCFCEMKWDSDISTSVSYDLSRNQLARVIENGLYFQTNGSKYADKVYVTLVTPEIYVNKYPKSRLYHYKYEDYKTDPQSLGIDLFNCPLGPASFNPECIDSRINALALNWVTYECLFSSMPASPVHVALHKFWKRYKKQ